MTRTFKTPDSVEVGIDLMFVDADMKAKKVTLTEAFCEWRMIRSGWTYKELVVRRKQKKERAQLNKKRSKSLKGKSLEELTTELESRASRELDLIADEMDNYEDQDWIERYNRYLEIVKVWDTTLAPKNHLPLIIKEVPDLDLYESNGWGLPGLGY